MFSFFIPLISMAWGIYCLRKGCVWVRTREPQYREEVGEVMYIGINAMLVFVGFFAMVTINQVSLPPIGLYLSWVFEVCVGLGKSQCREPTFFLRLVPGYLVTVLMLALFRPKRRLSR